MSKINSNKGNLITTPQPKKKKKKKFQTIIDENDFWEKDDENYKKIKISGIKGIKIIYKKIKNKKSEEEKRNMFKEKKFLSKIEYNTKAFQIYNETEENEENDNNEKPLKEIKRKSKIIKSSSKSKKKGKRKNSQEDNNNRKEDDNINNFISIKKKKKKHKSMMDLEDGNNIISIKRKKKKHKSMIDLDDELKKKIYLKTKQKIYNLFCSRRIKDEDEDDYLKTEDKGEEENDIKTKEENIDTFFNKIKTFKDIKYEGYDYTLKEDDYFERNGTKYKTILNSEDAAIKVCEEISYTINENESWLDPEFGPQPNNDIKGLISIEGENYIKTHNINPKNLYLLKEWYTLDKIFESPQFFSDGIESNDVIQGELGDCWFISALSVLATKDYLLRGEFSDNILVKNKIKNIDYAKLDTGVYPPIFYSFRKKGIFCFRFFKNFKWRYVLVDNRLPCKAVYQKQTPHPLFGKCRDPNEFWVPMIEKAYAKLHGAYKALKSGFISEGLVDLTGMTANKIFIKRNEMKIKQKADELWEKLKINSELTFDTDENNIFYDKKNKKNKNKKGKIAKFFTRNKTMMGCSLIWELEVQNKNKRLNLHDSYEKEIIIDNHQTGILAKHAYAILDVFEIDKPKGKKRKTSRLLRIRNPLGNRKEWRGKWCDGSSETIKNKEKIEETLNKKYKDTKEKINLSQEDGTFLMCFSDFREIFNTIYICKNFPPNYVGIRIYSKWDGNGAQLNIDENNKKFWNYPQYFLNKQTDGIISICLIQNDGRLNRGVLSSYGQYRDRTMLCIFKVSSKEKINSFKNRIYDCITKIRENTFEENLPKGFYIIMPCCEKEEDYCLELHFEDELIENFDIKGSNKVDCLKNNNIEKLQGNEANWEIITEFTKDFNKSISNQKTNFIIQKFKDIIKDDDDFIYPNTDRNEILFKTEGNSVSDIDYDYA